MKLITGMHRSGTSLVARLALEAGADLGDPETFYPGDEWNPDGYFEQPEIHAINMPLVNGPFGRLAYFWLPSRGTVERRGRRRRADIERVDGRYAGKTVKENRFCLTMSAWRAEGASFERVLVCLRDPYAVARSLKRRNRIPLAHGYRLWTTHVARLMAASDDLPLHFLRYDHLLDAERGLEEVRAAWGFLGLSPSAAEGAAIYERCVKPSLNHTSRPAPTRPRDVERRYGELLERHSAQGVGAAAQPAVTHEAAASGAAEPEERRR